MPELLTEIANQGGEPVKNLTVLFPIIKATPRKPKQKKPKPDYDPRHPHVSTARLLAQKQKSRASPNK